MQIKASAFDKQHVPGFLIKGQHTALPLGHVSGGSAVRLYNSEVFPSDQKKSPKSCMRLICVKKILKGFSRGSQMDSDCEKTLSILIYLENKNNWKRKKKKTLHSFLYLSVHYNWKNNEKV